MFKKATPETQVVSLNDQKIKTNGNELSIDTIVKDTIIESI